MQITEKAVKKNAFVFAVCGSRHAARLNISLRFLKRFSRSEIVVVKSRTKLKVDCDQVIDAKVPANLDNRRAGIFLKTSLHKILGLGPHKFCYLDSDVVAVNENVDSIFSHARSPVSFATDHCKLSQFSRYAVHCRCGKKECEHLQKAIRKQFGVKITDKEWRHWNGGVFVFDEASSEFMEFWHASTLAIFDNPFWQVRDQGTLAATAWKLNLQNQPVLPREFNYIVDRFGNGAGSRRATLSVRKFFRDESYSLVGGTEKPRPSFLHFINGGIGKRGWKNWDEVEQLAGSKNSTSASGNGRAVQRPSLSADNRAVHGMWIGETLSKMELLTIRSFLRHGHEFHLWVYDLPQTVLPKEVILEDANEIIPQKRIFKKAETDPETGIGKGSCSPFSDLFRYKLLYEKGGYWVDMDVTCLRPFNFSEPYVFRSHRVGVAANIIKCPPHSRLMKMAYEKIARQTCPHSEWLMPLRLLSQLIRRLGLTRYIRAGIWNEDLWWDTIRPLALGDASIPSDWFAIHWINEFWRTLKETGGVYRGQRLFEVAPDKGNPQPRSALARLYSDYGLADVHAAPDKTPVKQILPAPLEKPAERQPATPQFVMTSHINILLPSLNRGGAEREVLETLSGLQRRNSSGKLFVLHDTRPSYGLDATGNIKVYRFNAPDLAAKLHAIAAEILASPEPTVFTHLIRAESLRYLWQRGVKTIPVIHNSQPSWQDSPAAYNHRNVPFVVAVSEAVAQELRKAGCPKRVVVVRHELQRWFNPEEQQANRRQIRDRYGIADNTLVIGMVGEFKSQKAYTRAVRVLAEMRQLGPAKLMILGGWDHEWGYGRQAYTAACRLALELGVITDLIAPGPVPDAEKYYAAFDVFLNTSVYEGLSVALLEAIQTGCPIVTADAGGNRETLPGLAVLIQNPSDTDAYVQGIIQALQVKSRVHVQKPPDFDLVPRLWCFLGRYAKSGNDAPSAGHGGTLFITNDLDVGGAQRSLTKLLCHLPPERKTWLCVLETVHGQGYLDELQNKCVPVFSVRSAGDYLDRAERILCLVERLNPRNLCFWNVDTRIKLILAKILPRGAVRLLDVSPDSSLFMQIDSLADFERRISFSAEDYWARLDHFVAGYADGAPPNGFMRRRKFAVIPDGISTPLPGEPLSQALPKGADPDLVVGTTCPIMPGKRIEFLMDLMVEINQRLKGVALIIGGGIHPRYSEFWPVLLDNLHARHITNIHFAGSHAQATPLLKLFKVYLAVSEWPGFPHGCLEAMALGIPVVANGGAGLDTQMHPAESGIVIERGDPKAMARQVQLLLTNAASRRRLGAAARKTAAREFPMSMMVRRYSQLLDGPVSEARVAKKSRR